MILPGRRTDQGRYTGVMDRVMVLLLLLLLTACRDAPGLLAQIQERGTLVVATRNAPTTYYIGRDGPAGPEYDMARDFARHLGVELELRVKETLAEVFTALDRGEVDLAAAGLTFTPERARRYLFGPTYQAVRQQLVCRRGGPQAASAEALARVRLVVPAGSSYVARLEQLRSRHPTITWELERERGTEALLAAVWRREIDCTVADSHIVAINRRYYPELKVMFDLGGEDHLAWALPMGAVDLQAETLTWFADFRARGAWDSLWERYYGHLENFDYVDVRRFLKRVRTRLPRYRPWFEEAGARHGIPWTLLAAQAYQESHWNRRARSPTGVRGLMMLTLTTARELGIKSRLDARQSIFGGAKYLARLRDRLPQEIEEPDRTWMALAAYNVGYGHLRDAWELARRLGKEPYRWDSLREVLPLLAEKRYYRRLKYGYARGWEPVLYVQRIRDFQDLLERHLAETEGCGEGAHPQRLGCADRAALSPAGSG